MSVVAFTQYEGQYALFSSEELTPGQVVGATTASGNEVDVIVGEILAHTEEGTYALFERATEERDPSIATFAKRDGQWVVRGQDLYVGDVVTVEHAPSNHGSNGSHQSLMPRLISTLLLTHCYYGHSKKAPGCYRLWIEVPYQLNNS